MIQKLIHWWTARKKRQADAEYQKGYKYALKVMLSGDRTPVSIEAQAYRYLQHVYQQQLPFERGMADAVDHACATGIVKDDRYE